MEDMKTDKLKLIHDLMGELIGDMEPSKDDFMERLGKKPEVAAIKIEGHMPGGEDEYGDSMDDCEVEPDADDMPMNEDDKLKERLLRLKG